MPPLLRPKSFPISTRRSRIKALEGPLMANEPLLNGNQSVLDVIYQPYGSAIDRYAADGVGEIGGG